MKKLVGPGLGMLAGIFVGAIAVGGLHAQGKTPTAYAVLALTDIDDANGYKVNVVDKAVPLIKKHGGTFLVATNEVTSLRDPALKRLVVIAWDNAQQAKDWYSSDEMKDVRAYLDQHDKGPFALANAASQ
jgi:uncharacterized protein (DUF1330 family)